jgi:arylsulfatase
VDTPNFTRMAEAGLRYNRFHVTALCSPSRAALLTGRNHHAVGFGSIGELSSGFPGYTAFVPKDCAPFPGPEGERLRDGRHRQVAHDS